LKREKLWARLYVLPAIQAEWDREWMKWRADQLAKEAEIMKNVPGWVVGEKVYENSRWAPQGFDLDGNPVSKFASLCGKCT
jgi:NADH dehydrogenase (ubiquinone) 1 alpha subcomplex subunit 13